MLSEVLWLSGVGPTFYMRLPLLPTGPTSERARLPYVDQEVVQARGCDLSLIA